MDGSTLLPQFEEGTGLEEQLRVLLDRLETAQTDYPCKYFVTTTTLISIFCSTGPIFPQLLQVRPVLQ